MNPTQTIRRLIQDCIESGRRPEEVCEGYPELLADVRRGLARVRAMEEQLGAMFPSSDATGVSGRSAAPREFELPRIPGYEVEGVLGHGGMGVVYKARRQTLNRLVALKMPLSGVFASPAEKQRLIREAQAVARLSHPNIVTVYDVGEVDGRPYFTMELIHGENLAVQLNGVPQAARDAATLTATLADAIHFAHQAGVVHRDLKPGNVLLAPGGAPKISDFGLARAFDGASSQTLTLANAGTPSYMAPEQAAGRPGANSASVDIYALGAMLYELLTGRPPFRAATALETQRQVLEEEPAPPSKLNAKVPRDLETICLACLQKDPRRRYATAQKLADDLRRYLRGEPIHARPIDFVERIAKWARRRPAQAIAWLVVIVATLVTISVLLRAASQRSAIALAVAADLAEVERLEQASDWRGARDMLERARMRLAAGPRIKHFIGPIARIGRGLNLVERLGNMRLERAASQTVEFDRSYWSRQYRKQFSEEGLLHDDDTPGEFAARVARSPLRTALISAMDDWSICVDNKQELDWLQTETRLADPDPLWRDRARSDAVWNDPDALLSLAREAQVEREPIHLLLMIAGRLYDSQPEDALALLHRVQSAHPSDFWANYALGDTLQWSGNPDAIGYFRAAIALRPEAAIAHVNLAIALGAHERYSEAIAIIRHAIELDPENYVPQQNLAIWLVRERNYEAALAPAQAAARVNPDEGMAHGILGSILMRLERPDEAAASFRRAIELLPEDHERRESFLRALKQCESASTTEPQP